MPLILEKEPGAQFREVAKLFIASFSRPSFDGSEGETADDESIGEAATPKRLERSSGKGSGKSSGKTDEQIIGLLSDNAGMTIPDLAETLGITTRAIEKQVRRLREQCRLRRVGPAKGGHWEVVK